ncbi:MAG: dihydrolipoamide acetyltransferase family protein [Bacteroidota bacterium]
MSAVELIMPKMGESIMEATILRWLKKPGDRIGQDESVLEVATDKVDTEVPCMYAGTLVSILAQEGEVVPVGKVIAIIEAEGVKASAAPARPAAPVKETLISTPAPVFQAPVSLPEIKPAIANGTAGRSRRFYSPLVKTMAHAEKIAISELDTIPGTGAGGRLTKRDLQSFLQYRRPAATASAPHVHVPLVPASISADDEIVQMDRMRKMIAERMVDSKRVSPHVTSFVEADMTAIVKWRDQAKHEFQQKHGEALTFTPFFVEAVAKAIRDFPMINIQVDGDRIVRKKDINIGVAVALPTGNLIVPVIRHADRLDLTELAKAVNDLARRGRENRLKPDDLAGGTYTISNVGSFGNVMGTPIIMQPQVAILAIGAIIKKPAVVETPEGDIIAIRHKMFLSHSYDHRVVDGALGGSFVRRVADYLEKAEARPI